VRSWEAGKLYSWNAGSRKLLRREEYGLSSKLNAERLKGQAENSQLKVDKEQVERLRAAGGQFVSS